MGYIGQKPALVQSTDIKDNAISSAKIADNAVDVLEIANNAVTEAKINTGAVTNAKIADSNISENKIATAAVTDAKIGAGAVTEAKINTGAVTNAKIADSNISENKIASSAVTEAKIGTGAVTADKIGAGAVTEAKIGSAAITSSKLAQALDLQNPSVSLGIFERANVQSTACPATVTFDVLNQGVMFFTGNSTSNVRIDFRGNATTTLNNALTNTANTVTAVLLMTNGATPYYINNVTIDGVVVHNDSVRNNLFWQGNVLTRGGHPVAIDAYSFTIIKIGNASYRILASQVQNRSQLS